MAEEMNLPEWAIQLVDFLLILTNVLALIAADIQAQRKARKPDIEIGKFIPRVGGWK